MSPSKPPPDYERDACFAPGSLSLNPYERLLARLRRQRQLFQVTWELTHTCNFDCVMCYNVPLSQPELSTEESLDILEQLAALGALRLTFTGGEILMRPDFFVIARRARSLGFALELKTNGSLITPERADKIADLAPLQVDISLLGATASTFDHIARRSNSLQRVLQGVRLLQERGVRVKLNTLLMSLNLDQRQQMVELAKSLGVQYEQVYKIEPRDDGQDKAGAYQLSRQQMTALFQDADSHFQPLPPPQAATRTCSVGLSSCLISPYGEVYPCTAMRISAGNLRQQSFAEIWRQAPIFQNLRARHSYQYLPDCIHCPLNRYCEGRCAGLAWKEHGDLYGGHLLACRQAQARFAQLHPQQPIPLSPLQERLKHESS